MYHDADIVIEISYGQKLSHNIHRSQTIKIIQRVSFLLPSTPLSQQLVLFMACVTSTQDIYNISIANTTELTNARL